MFDKDIDIAIKKAYEKYFDSNAMHLVQVAQIIWKGLFGIPIPSAFPFLTSTKVNVSPLLLQLSNMIFVGQKSNSEIHVLKVH